LRTDRVAVPPRAHAHHNHSRVQERHRKRRQPSQCQLGYASGLFGSRIQRVQGHHVGLYIRAAQGAAEAVALNKEGIAKAQEGKNEEARDLFAKALAADPDNPDALCNHAKVSLMLKDPEAAQRDIDRLDAKHPNFPLTWLPKARLLLTKGDRDGARAVVKGFLAHSDGADPKAVQSANELLKRIGN
jgi:predicted Zn-dependent protease